MADIPVQKKNGGAPWLWWLLGLAVLALLVWVIAEAVETEPEPPEEALIEETTPEPVGDAAMLSASEIFSNPGAYIGEAFPQTEVDVSSVPTDRGFWIADQGDSLFAVIIDTPQEQPKDINPGQRLRLEGGTMRDASFLPDLQGAPLDQQTEDIAESQGAFVVVDERNIAILEGGQPQPGSDPAQSIQ